MDYEKKYKEALERAKTLYENANGMILKKWVEQVFPELIESEGERIRKELIGYHRSMAAAMNGNRPCVHEAWIAWLEKQGKQKPTENVNGDDYGIDGLWHAITILESTLGEVEGYQSDDGILEHKAAITAVKKLYGQKSATWSEEDETGWTNTMIMIKEVASNHYTKDSVKLVIDWLKTLKQRIGG